MATGLGSATLDFGAAPGSNESVAEIADVAVTAGAVVEGWIAGGDSTVDHTAADHRYLAIWVAITGVATEGVGITLYGRSEHKIEGTVACRYIWAD